MYVCDPADPSSASSRASGDSHSPCGRVKTHDELDIDAGASGRDVIPGAPDWIRLTEERTNNAP
jgi:hypothetical protein